MRYALVLTIATACALTAGCGGAKSSTPTTTAAAAPVESSATTPEVTAPAKTPLVAPPTDPQGYIAALRAIDPRLVVKEDRALRQGKSACYDLRVVGEDRALVVDRGRQRHSTSTVELTAEQAERAVAAAERHYCPA